MKKNAETAASYVQRAISETGSDFALSNARRYLVAAFNELTKVQNKREKREKNFQLEEKQRLAQRLSFEEARKRLQLLDKMLKEEEAKLQNGSNQF